MDCCDCPKRYVKVLILVFNVVFKSFGDRKIIKNQSFIIVSNLGSILRMISGFLWKFGGEFKEKSRRQVLV